MNGFAVPEIRLVTTPMVPMTACCSKPDVAKGWSFESVRIQWSTKLDEQLTDVGRVRRKRVGIEDEHDGPESEVSNRILAFPPNLHPEGPVLPSFTEYSVCEGSQFDCLHALKDNSHRASIRVTPCCCSND